MISTKAYMFRHLTAIFREWSEVNRWTCEPEDGSPLSKQARVPTCHELRFMIYILL